MKISVSPSKLETFRKHIDGEYNDTITEEKVIETIKGEAVWTPQATLGSAFHAVIEHGEHKYYNQDTGKYHVQDDQMPSPIIFKYSELKEAVKHRNRYAGMVYEVKMHLKMKVDEHDVFISMRIDNMHGIRIHDTKTSNRAPSVEFYYRSYQWRIYLLASGAQLMQYDHFRVKEYVGKDTVFEPLMFQFLPYLGMEQDVKNLIRGYVKFCERKGLTSYILSKYQ